MSPLRIVALSLLAALASAALPAAADARAPRPRCNLAGPNLAPSRTVKIVTRDYEDGQRLVGCVRPGGRPRVLVDAEDMGLGEGVARLVDLQGTWALVSEGASNQYGFGSALRVVDVRTGRGYELFAQGAAHSGPPPESQLSAYAINARGWAAVVIDHLNAGGDVNRPPTVAARRVLLHAPSGNARHLAVTFQPADIDPASLILDLRTVLWRQDGAVHYQRF